jgi:PadR family transcriptional regulator, regulatory protein PadR
MAAVGLMQGTLDLLVLKALTWGPMHGYAVTRWVKDATEGKLEIEDGALYPALHRLEKRGWATSDWGVSESNRRAKYYQLTAEGRRGLRQEASAWHRYAEMLAKVLAVPAQGAA